MLTRIDITYMDFIQNFILQTLCGKIMSSKEYHNVFIYSTIINQNFPDTVIYPNTLLICSNNKIHFKHLYI